MFCYLLLSIQQITGESRGFAFVTFSTIDEARKWLEMKQVEMLGDEQYSMAFSKVQKKDKKEIQVS